MTVPPAEIQMHLVDTAEDVETFTAWLRARLDAGTTLAIDTETTGLQWWQPDFVRLWQVSDDDEGYAIPVSWWGRVIAWAMESIAAARIPVVMHHAKYDMHAMRQAGWTLPAWGDVHDTALLHHLHRSDLASGLKTKHTAEVLGSWIFTGSGALQARAKELGLPIKGGEYWRHMPVDDPAYWGYGVLDTVITRRLFDEYAQVLADFKPQYERERRYQQIMYEVEQRGVRLDISYTQDLSVRLAREADTHLAFLRSHGLDNPNSHKQVLDMLETDFDFVPWEWTDAGQPSVNKHVLSVLAQAGGLQAEVVEALVAYKRATKWRSAYAEGFLAGVDIRGRVHPSIKTLGAKTGRSSVTGPPLQTLPSGDPLIRRCLLANPKEMWYSIDFSNQEPRALAHYGGSPALLRLFTEGSADASVHDFVANEMFGADYTKEQRSLAKVFGLSRSYGAGARTIAHASGLSEAAVKGILPRYDALVGLDKLNAMVEQIAAERDPVPYVITSGGRRVYAAPDKTYKLVNYLMQGSGADMLKDAVIALDDAGLSEYILLPVHDEVCFSFPTEEGPALSELAAKVMTEAADQFAVPMPVDIEGPARSWGGLSKYD